MEIAGMRKNERSVRAFAQKRGGKALELERLEPRILLDAPSPVIQQMVDQVSEASYTDYLAQVGSFPDRNSYTENLGLAADYIVGELEDMGLQVEVQTFALPSLVPIEWNDDHDWAPVSNIVATIPGTVTPEQQYMLTCHYDSIGVNPHDYDDPMNMVVAMLSPSSPAPGVDDNGSGTAALLESARVMSQYPFESTVKFVFFGAEEEGLVGSDYFTRYAYYEDSSVDAYYADPAHDPSLLVVDPDDIRGSIQYDMIAYWDGDPAGGETLDVVSYTGQTYGIEDYPNLQWLVESISPDLTPAQIQYVIASLAAAIPPPPADSVDSSLLAETFAQSAVAYNTGLQVNNIEGSTSDDWWLLGASDHFNFWWYGWPALLGIEDIVYGIDPDSGYPYSTVTNPYYHSADDNFENANAKDMATAATRTGVATIAQLAGVRTDVLDGSFDGGALEALYETEGAVMLVEVEPGNEAAQLTEGSDAAIRQSLVIPPDAGLLTFDYSFADPGDGDSLTVRFGGQELFNLVGTDVPDSDWHSAQVDVSSYAGQPGALEFRLNSVGAANAQYQLDNVAFAPAQANQPPEITLDEPAPGTSLYAGDSYMISWSDSDPDDDAQISLYWDTDTDSGNNDPADEGATWGVIATLISEDDPSNTFEWTVDAPGGDFYLYALIDDGVATDEDYTATTLRVARFALLDSRLVDGALISFYDVDPLHDLSEPVIAWSRGQFARGVTDVLVNPGRIGDGIINSITLYGDGTETADLGVVVEHNVALNTFVDRRTATPPLGFLASQGRVGSVRVRAGIEGANLNGFTTEGGQELADDLDGDGESSDLTGFFGLGPLGRLVVRGDVDGDVIVAGNLKTLQVTGGNLNGDVFVPYGSIGRITVRALYDRATGDWIGGNATGDIRAGQNLSGRYNFVSFYHDAPAGGPHEMETYAGYVTFDGLGQVSDVGEVEAWGGPGWSSSGTYSLDRYGRVVAVGMRGYGLVSENGELVVFADLDPDEDEDLGMSFFVKSSSSLTEADLSGRYNMVSFFHDAPASDGPQELVTSAGYVTFDGAGNWTAVPEIEAFGDEGEVESGTYALDEDGRLIIDGENSYGMVTPDGQVLIVPDLDPEGGDDVGITFLVKSSSGLSESDTAGRYNMLLFYHDVPAGDPRELGTGAGYMRLDGAGHWAYIGQVEAWGGRGGRDSGTYSIGDYGRLLLDGENTYGMVSPDGQLVIVPNLDPDDDSDLGMNFMVKASEAFVPSRIGAVTAVGGHITGGIESASGAIGSVLARAVWDRDDGQWRGGNVSGHISAAGNIGAVSALGGDLTAHVTSTTGIVGSLAARSLNRPGAVQRGGDVTGDLAAGAGLRRLFVGADLSGALSVKGNLGSIIVRGNMLASAINTDSGGLASLWVGGDVQDASLTIDGLFRNLHVGGDFYNSNIEAGTLRRVRVGSTISEDLTDGDTDGIHAGLGRSFIRDSTGSAWVYPGHDHWFNGVEAWVG